MDFQFHKCTFGCNFYNLLVTFKKSILCFIVNIWVRVLWKAMSSHKFYWLHNTYMLFICDKACHTVLLFPLPHCVHQHADWQVSIKLVCVFDPYKCYPVRERIQRYSFGGSVFQCCTCMIPECQRRIIIDSLCVMQ